MHTKFNPHLYSVMSAAERLRQTMAILKKLTEDLGIPYKSAEIQELKGHMDEFIRTGEPWEGRVVFEPWGRVANCVFTQAGNMEVTLQVLRKRKAHQ